MWVILAGTVGMAAVVNSQLNRLGDPVTIDGVTLRLPSGWEAVDDDPETIELRERGESSLVRQLTVGYGTPAFSLSELFSGGRGRAREQSVELSDGRTASLRIMRRELARDPRGIIYELDVSASVPTPAGKKLIISITQVSIDVKSDGKVNEMLMRKILDSVRYE